MRKFDTSDIYDCAQKGSEEDYIFLKEHLVALIFNGIILCFKFEIKDAFKKITIFFLVPANQKCLKIYLGCKDSRHKFSFYAVYIK